MTSIVSTPSEGALSPSDSISLLVTPVGGGGFLDVFTVTVTYDGGGTYTEAFTIGGGFENGFSGTPVTPSSSPQTFVIAAPPWPSGTVGIHIDYDTEGASGSQDLAWTVAASAGPPAPPPPSRSSLASVHTARFTGGEGVSFGTVFGGSETP